MIVERVRADARRDEYDEHAKWNKKQFPAAAVLPPPPWLPVPHRNPPLFPASQQAVMLRLR
jgi:hypothetical protein